MLKNLTADASLVEGADNRSASAHSNHSDDFQQLSPIFFLARKVRLQMKKGHALLDRCSYLEQVVQLHENNCRLLCRNHAKQLINSQ